VSKWGKENAQDVCRISIFVTDKDQRAVASLKEEILNYSLGPGACDCIHFERPDFTDIIENHTLDMITTRRNSYSILAFCGSPALAGELHHLKINNDMVAAVTGNELHQMEFVSESYGGGKKKASIATKTAGKGEEVVDDTELVTTPDPVEDLVESLPTRGLALTKYGPSTRKLTTFGASTRDIKEYTPTISKRAKYGRTASMMCLDSDEEEDDE
jgi:hypothetical protein